MYRHSIKCIKIGYYFVRASFALLGARWDKITCGGLPPKIFSQVEIDCIFRQIKIIYFRSFGCFKSSRVIHISRELDQVEILYSVVDDATKLKHLNRRASLTFVNCKTLVNFELLKKRPKGWKLLQAASQSADNNRILSILLLHQQCLSNKEYIFIYLTRQMPS